MEKKFIPFAILEKFMVNVMVKAGIPEADAKIVGDVLLQADKLGFDSHGVNRFKSIYLDRIREGILAALIHKPDLFLLDEPFEGVDAVGARLMKEILLEQARRGATIFLTSHVLEV